jgi:non-ribosomal peptide synthetase component E (peptide arylation enzyme)
MHHDLLAEVEKLAQLSQLTYKDCILSQLPFAHRRGFVAGLLAVVAAGAKMILTEPANEAALLDTIAQQDVTIYSGYPANFERLVDAATARLSAKSALRLCWCDSAALSPEAVQAMQRREGLGLQLL